MLNAYGDLVDEIVELAKGAGVWMGRNGGVGEDVGACANVNGGFGEGVGVPMHPGKSVKIRTTIASTEVKNLTNDFL